MATEYNLNDVFQIQLNGQLVDCIKASAYYRETIKASNAVYYCNGNKSIELVKLKMAVDETYNWSLWIADSQGTYTNPDTTVIAYSANDLMYTYVNNGQYYFRNIGSLLKDTDISASIPILASTAELYPITNLPRGAVAIVGTSTFTLYVKITNKSTATQASDWYALTIKSASSSTPVISGGKMKCPVMINSQTGDAYIEIPIYDGTIS